MKAGKWLFIALALCAAAPGLAPGPRAAQPESRVGYLGPFRGDVYFRKSDAERWRKLDPQRDLYKWLYAGDRLRCSPRASAVLYLYNEEITITERDTEKPGGGYHIRRRESGPRSGKTQAVENFGQVGGWKLRSGGVAVYWPAADSTVRAETLEFRWLGSPSMGRVSLILRDEDGNEFWRQDALDGASGAFDSRAARAKLAAYRRDVGNRLAAFVLADSAGNQLRVNFYVLSAKSERALAAELAEADKAKGLERYVLRAYAFTRRNLYDEATQEYDDALQLAPLSSSLLDAAIQAHTRTGNSARVRELREKLPAVPE